MTEKQLYRRVKIIIFCAILLLFVLLSIIGSQLVIRRRQEIARQKLESIYLELQSQEDELEREIAYRKSRAFIEEYAREYYGYGYESEEKYVPND